MKKSFTLLLLLFTGFGFAAAQETDEKQKPLSVGQVISDSLGSQSTHSYTLELEGKSFVLGFVNQESVDVVVKVLDPEENVVRSFDGPARGPEYFQFSTDDEGTYTVEVTPFQEKTGTYSIELQKIEPEAETPEGKVDQLMAMYDSNKTPGGVVAVIKNGEMIFSKGYGMAHFSYDIPYSTDVLNNIGSVSKQFTAFAMSLLAEEGKISLDDDIRKYIPELPEFEDTVTIRHMLSHTSGYREYLNTVAFTGRKMNDHFGRDEIIKILQSQPKLQNTPGSEYNYNNSTFSLLTKVVEEVTDQKFPAWMAENIFQPLEMNDTYVRKNPDAIIPNRSMGYVLSEDGNFSEIRDLSAAMGASAIYTNVHDLAKWIKNYEDPKVGNERIVKEMTTKNVLSTGDTTSYGLGLFIGEMNGLKLISHGGSDMAHRSMMLYFPEIDAAVITLSNYASFMGNIATQVAEEFFSEEMDTDENEDSKEEMVEKSAEKFEFDYNDFDEYEGLYALEDVPNFNLNLFKEEDKLYLQATAQQKVEIKPTTDSTFTLSIVDASVTFHRDENGEVNSLTLHQNGNHKATRVKEEPWVPTVADSSSYVGRYFSEELQTFYEIAIDDSSLIVQHRVMDKLKLSAIEEDTFSSSFPISELKFIRNEQGDVTSFTVSNGRARDILFEKINTDVY